MKAFKILTTKYPCCLVLKSKHDTDIIVKTLIKDVDNDNKTLLSLEILIYKMMSDLGDTQRYKRTHGIDCSDIATLVESTATQNQLNYINDFRKMDLFVHYENFLDDERILEFAVNEFFEKRGFEWKKYVYVDSDTIIENINILQTRKYPLIYGKFKPYILICDNYNYLFTKYETMLMEWIIMAGNELSLGTRKWDISFAKNLLSS